MLCTCSLAAGRCLSLQPSRANAGLGSRLQLRLRAATASGRRAGGGVRCTAAPDGSKPRLPSRSPNKEDIKKAILGYTADGASGALQPSGGQQPGGGHASSVALAHVQQEEVVAEPGSWEDWKQYIEGLDAVLQDIQTLDSELADAVRLEDYRRAAALKARLAELEQQDVVGAVLQEMDAALAAERYGEAAQLRDAGGVGLIGWWAGRGEEDAVGHVVRITPEFGRYVAQAFTARDLADSTGWSREMSLRELLLMGSPGDGEQPRGAAGPQSDEELGLPVFEVCLRRSPDDGSLEQQPVALFSPVDLQGTPAAGDLDQMSTIVANQIQGIKGGVVTVEKDEDGEVLSISVELEADLADDSDEEEDGAGSSNPISNLLESVEEGGIVSLDQLASFFPSAQEPLDLRQYSSSDELSEDDVQQQISDALQGEEASGARQGGGDASGSGAGFRQSSLEQLMAEIEGRAAPGGGSSAEQDEPMEFAVRSSGGDGEELGEEGQDGIRFASLMLQRAPAQIEWHTRDSFTIRASPVVPQQQEQQQQMQLAATAGGSGTAVAAQLRQPPGGEPAAASSRQLEARDAGAAQPPAAPEGSGEPAPGGDRSERLQRLEAEVQQWAERRGAKKEQIEAILKATMAAAIAQGIGAVAGEPQPSPVGLEGMCSYARIPTEHFCKTDPFSGLYLGAFGPHGPELLQLSRVLMDGEEWVHATKVTGDRNVPAGEVSFRAKVARQHRLSASESYPLELGVKGRYKGQGRVAQEGFVHPKWVEGELLLLTPANSMTHGAELGFVYNMDGVKRFLILFSRIDLDALDP